MRYEWLVLVLGATACADGGGSDDTDTDVTSTDGTDTDDDATDDDSDDAPTDDEAETDVADTDDTDPPADISPPTPQETGEADYTTYFDGTAVNIYWRAAVDDMTLPDNLEYRASCQPSGGATTSTAWMQAINIPVEGSGRYWVAACPGDVGTYDLWVEVRDAAGNTSPYPTLSAVVEEVIIHGPK